MAARVFGRALGARDLALALALGLGTLAAFGRPDGAGAWLAAGALSDALDVAASVSSWHELPRVSRWPVVLSAGGAAAVGALAAVAAVVAVRQRPVVR